MRRSPRRLSPSRASIHVRSGALDAPMLLVSYQALNELPQPQPPVAFGFENVKPDPCIEET